MNSGRSSHSEEISPFQLVLAVLSILLLGTLLINVAAPVPPEVSKVLQMLDVTVCGLFLLDLLNRFIRARDKRRFMRWGWIDLLASIPNVDWLRFGRLARLTRILMMVRAVRVGHRLFEILKESKRQSVAATAVLITILLIVSSSVTMLLVENGEDANIRTAEDAVWWSITTITTVGYGDRYPITSAGRAVAVVLMVCGVGLFGTLGGLMASLMLGRGSDSTAERQGLAEAISKLEGIERRLEILTVEKRQVEPEASKRTGERSFEKFFDDEEDVDPLKR